LFSLACSCGLSADSHQPRSKNTFLIVSDIHFNPMADTSLVVKLAAADPDQWETIFAQSKNTAFSQYGEDTNWWLLQSSLDAMHVTIPHPAFIMTNGDMLAHHFPQTFVNITHDEDREDYRKFVRKTIEFLSLEFRKRYPDTAILVTPGNNDDECGNYSIYATGAFLHDTAEVARKLAHGDDEFIGSWEALGSYDIPNPAFHGLRIISLNTIFLSALYKAQNFNQGCETVPSTAATDLLTWLESRLVSARQAHEKVWLMFHIPPGIDSYTTMHKYQALLKGKPNANDEKLCLSAIVPMWVPKWTGEFDKLLEKYQDVIVASFAGHTHSDDFRVINPSAKEPQFVLISAAISPVYNQNPSFRLVRFAKDGSLVDNTVYYLTNLLFASGTTPGEWKREYTFSEQWKLPRLDGASLAALYNRIQSQQSTGDEWLRLYNVSSSAAYLPANPLEGFACAIEGLDADAYGSCYCRPPANHPSGAAEH
ncbi:MAG: metallophosphoesterase, partial [Candidatus Korobacteraceae bacterium]